MSQAPTVPNVPVAEEFERALLAAALLEPELVAYAGRIVAADDFWHLKHATLWRVMTEAHSEGHAIDALTVSERLESANIQPRLGFHDIAMLMTSIGSAANWETYAQVVRAYADRRRLMKQAAEVMRAAQDTAVPMDDVLSKVEGLQKNNGIALPSRVDGVPLSKLLHDQIDDFERLEAGEVVSPRIPCRMASIQAILGGYVPGGVYTIAARPGGGKSTLLHNEMLHLSRALGGRKVYLYSYEMTVREVANTVAASAAHVPHEHIEQRTVARYKDSWRDYLAFVGNVPEAERVLFNDKLPYWEDVKAHILAEARRGVVGAVAFDYLKLMRTRERFTGEGATRSRLSYLTREMKELAMETISLGCPVVVLMVAQINRSGTDEPGLEHLKDSGTIEEDSDAVIILHRDMNTDAAPAVVSKTIVKIPKNRHGPTGRTLVGFYGARKSFEELSRDAR